jgi:hypothetical protein
MFTTFEAAWDHARVIADKDAQFAMDADETVSKVEVREIPPTRSMDFTSQSFQVWNQRHDAGEDWFHISTFHVEQSMDGKLFAVIETDAELGQRFLHVNFDSCFEV